VTQRQNNQNHNGSYSHSKSGVRGVYWYKAYGKWVGQVTHEGKKHHIGYFDTIEAATEAVVAKRNELHTHNDRDRIGTLQTT
jgi:hypothetical protein